MMRALIRMADAAEAGLEIQKQFLQDARDRDSRQQAFEDRMVAAARGEDATQE